MEKKILYDAEARQKVKDGIDKVANAVITTLGPMGRNVIISRSFPSPEGMKYYQPLVTKDGITVARNIMLTDYLENVGCLMIKEAAEKTMSESGDGTTTTCLLVQAIVDEGIKLIQLGVNPQELKRGIDAAVEHVVQELQKMAIPVAGDMEKIRQIATVSANNDSTIGNLIAEAYKKIDAYGDITIEESKNANTEIKVVEGFKFDRGYFSHYFITDRAKGICELENPYILLYDKKVYQVEPMQPLLEQVIKSGRPLLVIAENADGEVLAGFAMNASRQIMQCCIVQSPNFGDAKREEMEDIALLTGGEYISDEKGISLKSTTLKELGQCTRVIITKDSTTIIGGKASKKKLDDLLNNLKMNLVGADDKEKEQIEKRIAKLTGGVAVLSVGAPTETEMREKKDRCDDAVRAVKAAIAEGYVPGGGASFFRISQKDWLFPADDAGNPIIPAIQQSERLIYFILKAPLKTICHNAGIDPQPKIYQIESSDNKHMGYNAKTDTIEDLVKSGIIDPVKVLRCSIQNAASTATMILTSNALICDCL